MRSIRLAALLAPLLTPLWAIGLASALATQAAQAAQVAYELDPAHTYPSFAADHMGMSTWRGKFTRNSGTLWLDKASGSGTIEVKIDIDSIDFGHAQMNSVAREPSMFDSAAHPYAFYRGQLSGFVAGGSPRIEGELTLRGVTRPLALTVERFHCRPHPLNKRDWCGADASARFQRDQWGLDAGKDWGFDMSTVLQLQVEAVARE